MDSSDVTIGLLVQRQEESYLETTLGSVLRNTDYSSRLVVILDGTEIENFQCAETFGHKVNFSKVVSNSYGRGLPGCSNLLIRESETPFLVLLHSGTYVGPRWLSLLIGALKSDNSYGITGPSTNLAWNEQQVNDQPSGTPLAIDAYAKQLGAKYNGIFHYLDVTHSLCEFCYCFKRDVVESIGYFDEDYGRGPCHEIDFSTRAYKAGYKGVWVRGAYVHRFPRVSSVIRREQASFQMAKKKYQSRFCGLNLGLVGDCPCSFGHCLGEDCEHFAPQGLTNVFVGMKPSKLSSNADISLVSCIMPTKNRRGFVSQAIKYFRQQDYPNKELIIVDNGQDLVGDLVPQDSDIHYRTAERSLAIGDLRNRAIEESHGNIIAHWDDDDWYGRTRLSQQINPILNGHADLTGLNLQIVYDMSNKQFWAMESWLHTQIIDHEILGSTMVYRKDLWQNKHKFSSINFREDAIFVNDVFTSGARILEMPNRRNFIYIRHKNNTWKFACGVYGNSRGWRRIQPPSFVDWNDLAFYQSAIKYIK